ncbi:MAG: YhbY family RNA-binding protein [Lachnospiraceae bacterium]|nr:YhbY family RNA-binding protein [Lachnospiraceae bacterium]
MNSRQRAYLMSLASNLDPVFQIGKGTLTPELTDAIRECIDSRELIKISVLKNCADDPVSMARTLAERVGAELVQVIGKRIVLFKENKKDGKIVLPK